MLFSSPVFFLFFVVYFLLHLAIPARYRVYLIIAGSTVFYAWWRVAYVWLPFALMLTAYGGVRWLESAEGATRTRRATAAVVMLLLPLLFFKYTNFILNRTVLTLSLPLGVSFVTFTLIAYIVDVYKRRFDARHSVSTLAAYVLFFPHLIAGPILRPIELIPQLEHPRRATLRRFRIPLLIFTFGLVKKLVFADQIAEAVDAIYAQAAGPLSPSTALVAIYGFAVQIYCDFSGYTDMAIGLAMALGVHLPNNFLRPYTARSIVDFWRRWHITLSFWLRDYLYIGALGGNRGGKAREIRNVILTMAIGGLWHGANWTFVVWGLFHGVGVASAHVSGRIVNVLREIPRWLGVLLTFHFVTIGWVFFRARTFGDALRMLEAPFAGGAWDVELMLSKYGFVLLLMIVFFVFHGYDDHRRMKLMARRLRPELLWPAIILLWIVAITVSQGSSAKFIYFDF